MLKSFTWNRKPLIIFLMTVIRAFFTAKINNSGPCSLTWFDKNKKKEFKILNFLDNCSQNMIFQMLNNQISCTFEHHFLRNLEVTFTKPRVLFDKFTANLYFDFGPPHFKLVETTYDNLFNTFKGFSTHFIKIGMCRI